MNLLDSFAWFRTGTSKKTSFNPDDNDLSRIGKRLMSSTYVKSTSSKTPQCIFKVASHAKGTRALTLMKYITRVSERDEQGKMKEELSFIDQDGFVRKGSDDIKEIYDTWKTDFERKKAGTKREPRHVTHIILSAKTDNDALSAKQINFAARDMLDNTFGADGYEYIYVVHRDTDHPHVHIVVKNYNSKTKRKLHLSREATFQLRQEWSEALRGRGIQAAATLRKDRKEVLQKVSEGVEYFKENIRWNEQIMRRSSEFSQADRLKLLGELDKLTKVPGLSEKEFESLSSLKDKLKISPKKVVLKKIVSIQNTFKTNPNLFEGLQSWIDAGYAPDMTFRQREYAFKRMESLTEDVKLNTLPLSKERRVMMREIRNLKNAIRSKSRKEISLSAQAVTIKAQKANLSLARLLDNIFKDAGKPILRRDVIFRKEAAKNTAIGLAEELRETISTVSDSSEPDKKEHLKALKNQLRLTNKVILELKIGKKMGAQSTPKR